MPNNALAQFRNPFGNLPAIPQPNPVMGVIGMPNFPDSPQMPPGMRLGSPEWRAWIEQYKGYPPDQIPTPGQQMRFPDNINPAFADNHGRDPATGLPPELIGGNAINGALNPPRGIPEIPQIPGIGGLPFPAEGGALTDFGIGGARGSGLGSLRGTNRLIQMLRQFGDA